MRRVSIFLLVFASGLAALSWEVLWQHYAALALGVSALGTALTLAITMGGMTLGALWASRRLERTPAQRPFRGYALCELVIGLSGLLMPQGFALLEHWDTQWYMAYPLLTTVMHSVGIALLLGLPTMAMGATIPLLGLVARQRNLSLASVYATNTAGAALGCLFIAFWLIPALGIYLTIQLVALINIAVCGLAWVVRPPKDVTTVEHVPPTAEESRLDWARRGLWIAAVTGFATFALEVAWFRSLRSAFQSTTDTFAIILAAVLIALAIGGRLATWIHKRGYRMPLFLALGGVGILLATPAIERFDLIEGMGTYWEILGKWALVSFVAMAPPILLLGTALPWLLEHGSTPRQWGRLYAVNTAGAIAGSLVSAWVLLPALGFAQTSWLVGILVALTGLWFMGPLRRYWVVALAVGALVISVAFESGIGRDRIQLRNIDESYEILDFAEGPDVTASVVAFESGFRGLYIDGFRAASGISSSSYMAWMGHLPAMMHTEPKDGLVICFGTGQTANALRQEGMVAMDVVDLSPAVISMASHFSAYNQGVLDDPRVSTIVMDGRAWLRRTDRRYDVITLEPMPPNFAGVNALYSEEFYRLASARLNPGGVIAQWVPYHILPPRHAMSVAATFQAVFPDSVLWVDPQGKTGILLGRHGEGDTNFASAWPGLQRPGPPRSLDAAAVRKALRLDVEGLKRYGRLGTVITDDNQLLSYGRARQDQAQFGQDMGALNLDLVERFREDPSHGPVPASP